MSQRQSMTVFVAIFVGVLVGVLSGRPASAQPASTGPVAAGATGGAATSGGGAAATVSATDAKKTEEKSVSEAVGLTAGADGGMGLSLLTNVTRLFANGTYDILSAGVGVGVSWKNKSESRFPLELGLYVAPQFAGGDSSKSSGSVAVILNALFFKGFGLGVGGAAWRTGTGFGGGGAGDRLFVTIGYGFTNDTKGTGR
jgi:hypothetical protein